MAAMETESVTESIAHLDFEPELGCGVRRPTPCAAKAEFIMRCRQCPWSMLICRTHRAEIEHASEHADGVVCGRCQHVSASLAAAVEFIPIDGRS